jgi:hypothetical protein
LAIFLGTAGRNLDDRSRILVSFWTPFSPPLGTGFSFAGHSNDLTKSQASGSAANFVSYALLSRESTRKERFQSGFHSDGPAKETMK